MAAVINVHPPSLGYGPTRLAKKTPPEKVMRRERRVRVGALEHSLRHAQRLVERQIPVVLLGDFNTPSHRDWTEATVGLRDHVNAPFEWPSSLAVEGAGLVDVYRQQHPDPVADPGITWPADRPFVKGYNPAKTGQAADRIDLMYASECASATSVQIVGEGASEYTDIAIDPWPSDHRALVAGFQLELGVCPPILASVRALNRIDDIVHVHYHSPEAVRGSIVAMSSADPTSRVVVADNFESVSGGVGILGSALGTGTFDLVLLSSGKDELARTTIWITGPDTPPTLTVGKAHYSVGEGIDVTWAAAPGNRADWIAVFDRGVDPATSKRKIWTYTGATVVGQHVLNGSRQPRRWPLEPGDYTAHLLLDDIWDSLAHAHFTVTDD